MLAVTSLTFVASSTSTLFHHPALISRAVPTPLWSRRPPPCSTPRFRLATPVATPTPSSNSTPVQSYARLWRSTTTSIFSAVRILAKICAVTVLFILNLTALDVSSPVNAGEALQSESHSTAPAACVIRRRPRILSQQGKRYAAIPSPLAHVLVADLPPVSTLGIQQPTRLTAPISTSDVRVQPESNIESDRSALQHQLLDFLKSRRLFQDSGQSEQPQRLVRPNLSPAAEAELLTRMLVAILAGAIIGVERRAASATAGIRTLTLVSLGAAIFSLTALHGLGSGDPARMGAAISTGIGFLGSGAINGQIAGSRRQLVTAASIWVAAALGVAAAAGLFRLAITGAFVTIWILRYRLIFSLVAISFKQLYPMIPIKSRLKAFNLNLNISDEEDDSNESVPKN